MSGTFEVEGSARHGQQVTGTVGLVVTIAVAVILGVHPFGSTELYDDGSRFVDHVDPFWVAIHVAGAVLLLAIPVVLAAWTQTLQTASGQVFGRLTVTASTVAVTLAVVHLVGTDTMTFVAYRDTLVAGVEGAPAGADVLLRLHAATLMAWVLTLFVAVPGGAAVVAACERDWRWRFWLPAAIAMLGVASISVTWAERQWTTLSEMGLLRPAITLFLVWFGLVAYRLRSPTTLGVGTDVADVVVS
jgi:hypothetical protein